MKAFDIYITMTAAFTLLILLLVRHDKKNAQKYAIAEIKPPIRDKKGLWWE